MHLDINLSVYAVSVYPPVYPCIHLCTYLYVYPMTQYPPVCIFYAPGYPPVCVCRSPSLESMSRVLPTFSADLKLQPAFFSNCNQHFTYFCNRNRPFKLICNRNRDQCTNLLYYLTMQKLLFYVCLVYATLLSLHILLYIIMLQLCMYVPKS